MASLIVAREEPGARASSGKSFQQHGPLGMRASSGKSFHQQGLPRTRASSSRDNIMHMVCFNTMSRTLTVLAREALVNLIIKNCKWEQLNWAEKIMKTEDYQQPRDGASKVNMSEFGYKSALGIRDSTQTIVGLTFGGV